MIRPFRAVVASLLVVVLVASATVPNILAAQETSLHGVPAPMESGDTLQISEATPQVDASSTYGEEAPSLPGEPDDVEPLPPGDERSDSQQAASPENQVNAEAQGSITVNSATEGADHAWAPVNIYRVGESEPAYGGLLRGNGNATFNGIDIGDYSITVESHGIYKASTVSVSVTESDLAPVVTVSYETFELATVTIDASAYGSDHEGELAYLFAIGPGEAISGQLSSSSSVTIPNVPYGDYTLTIASHGVYADLNMNISVQSSSVVVTPTFALLEVGTLKVIGGSDGADHAGALVSITPRGIGGEYREGNLDATGSFLFSDAPFGVYDLTIRGHSMYASYTEIVWIPDTGSITPVYERSAGFLQVPAMDLPLEITTATLTVSTADSSWSGSWTIESQRDLTVEVPVGLLDWKIDFGSGWESQSGTVQVDEYRTHVLDVRAPNPTVAPPPVLFLSTYEVQAGSNVEVSGSGFQPMEMVTIRFVDRSGPIVGSVQADLNGEFVVNVSIPSWAQVRVYWIVAMGDTSGKVAGTTVSITSLASPKITLGSSTIQAGININVSGSGYQALEMVTIRFVDRNGPIIGTAQADWYGRFSVNVSIPSWAQVRVYWVVAMGDTSGQVAGTTVSITSLAAPKVTLGSSTIKAGTNIIVSGSGYQALEMVTIRFVDRNGPIIGTVRTDWYGQFSINVTVPSWAQVRVYWVVGMGHSSGQVAGTTVSVSSLAAPTLTLGATTSQPGQYIQVSGSGYQALELVTIRFVNRTGPVIGTVRADWYGQFSVSVRIPTSAGVGYHWIVGMGNTSGRVAGNVVGVVASAHKSTVVATTYQRFASLC